MTPLFGNIQDYNTPYHTVICHTIQITPVFGNVGTLASCEDIEDAEYLLQLEPPVEYICARGPAGCCSVDDVSPASHDIYYTTRIPAVLAYMIMQDFYHQQ